MLLLAVAFLFFQTYSNKFFYSSSLLQVKSRPLERGLLQIRSSAWLEHYTDNVGVTSSNLVGSTLSAYILIIYQKTGGLAQLARASALHAEGHRFDSDILHQKWSSRVEQREREGRVLIDQFLIDSSLLISSLLVLLLSVLLSFMGCDSEVKVNRLVQVQHIISLFSWGSDTAGKRKSSLTYWESCN
jgi:hypothetical protein